MKAMARPAQNVLPTEPRGLRTHEAAKYAGVSHWFIRNAIWTGKLRARRAGKVIIILREDLDLFLDSLPMVTPSTAGWVSARERKRSPLEADAFSPKRPEVCAAA